MKLAVLYDSKSGNTKQAAEWIAAGMNETEGVEARAFQIGQEDADFVKGRIASSITAARRRESIFFIRFASPPFL